jgi:DNA-binding transcriptional LysR family regulator
MNTIESLRTFVRVLETGSLTAVAREMNADQSTICRQITQLEEHFGVRLLHRTTRHLSLTVDGQGLRDHARNVLEVAEGMEVALRRHKSSPTGHVRVATPVSFGLILMAQLPVAMARYPGFTVELVMEDRFGDMIEERLDLVVTVGEVSTQSLIKRSLGTVTRVAVAAPACLQRRGSPVKPNELIDHDCIVHRVEPGETEWRLTGPNRPVGVSVQGPSRHWGDRDGCGTTDQSLATGASWKGVSFTGEPPL